MAGIYGLETYAAVVSEAHTLVQTGILSVRFPEQSGFVFLTLTLFPNSGPS
jgi:hypothetical protein